MPTDSSPHARPGAADSTTNPCRRVWARYASSRPLPRQLSVADTDAPLDGWVLDVSAAGFGMILAEALPVGTLLMIELETCADAQPLKAVASVRYCRPQDGEFRHGCQFVAPLR